MDYFKEVLLNKGLSDKVSGYLAGVIVIFLLLALVGVIQLIVKKVFLKILTHYINRNKFKWDNIMLNRKVFHRLADLIPAIIVNAFAPVFEQYSQSIRRLVMTYVFLVIVFIVNGVLDSVDDIYRTYAISKIRPIKGLLQIIKIIFYIIMGIVIMANLMGENPLVLLSGIGALTAVISLVFKDSILGFVAGIQLTSNQMLRIGDWIEMTKYGADGDVIEITLNTVKVQNFDKTIVTIPAYALVSDSFKNWRGMQEFGGRRIKRSLYIDMTSIGFCTEDMLKRFKKIQNLSDYIVKKEAEINNYNKKYRTEESMVNGRHLTNIGTFREYISCYLKSHSGINQDMTLMVRQLAPGEHGLPLEIYAFTKEVAWDYYEGVQSDIFDHLLAVAPEFGLRLFQYPTGYDIKSSVK
ncbi:membrane protein [Anaerocolumna cellulosilytica]|uniref:Mechanosensing system component YbdG n=1 Tax=Anaerocolumna cellulosilytica TaxID=433286 RepID=A0A6S6RCP0_9FIRM|nr:mechanosensitive ion channel domain-containing protein [Anaerocolumna cellulosilytica]MBB5195282.1 miniconductance mechanosensitive channel [Anaerocolumna cellulosilytica]BCJ96755.1 membrane protein [Anaerocolumna cellulosilytica]